MAQFGWTVPVLVSGDGEVIAGHGRILAATQLGLTEAPVIVLDHLTEEQRKAYRLADNKLTELGAWDETLLAAELQELLAEDFDLSVVGFSDAELDLLLALDPNAENDAGEDGEDIPEAPADPVSRPGDLWLLGPHRLLCGDATVITDLDRLMAGRKADLCFTDSPYNVDYAGGVGAEKSGKGRRILNDALGDGFERFLYDASASIIAHTAGAIYMCMSSSELHTLQKAFAAAGGHWSTFIIWAKDRFTLGRTDYPRQFEPILYGWPEGAKHHWCGARDQGDVWFIDRPHRNDLHPTMKPVGLVERAIRNSSPRDGLVLDPFGGSGTTLIAAERTGRAARLIELDPRYVDVIVERWQAESGRDAVLDGDGRSFVAVKAERLGADTDVERAAPKRSRKPAAA
jgi:DNA modification methylase